MNSTPIRGLVEKIRQCDPRELGRDSIVYIDISSIDRQTKRIIEPQTILVDEAPSRARKQVHAYDVLVSTVRPNLNGVALVPAEYHDEIASTGFCVLRAKKDALDPTYLFYFTQTSAFVSRLTRLSIGAGYPAVSDGNILDTEIPLPPLPEQKHIAAILAKADRLRRLRRTALDLSDTYLQSVFLETFGDPVSNPMGWEIVHLEELLETPPQNGLYLPKEGYVTDGSDDGVEMVHMSDSFYGIVQRGHLKRVRIGQADIEKYSIDHNDLLIARRSLVFEGAAKPCRIPRSDEPLVFESAMIRITPDRARLLPVYLYHYLANDRARLSRVLKYVTQSTISGINQSGLKRVEVVLPPLSLQQQFAHIVHKLERLRAQQREAERQAEHLFQTLLHRAFRGEL